jgi:tetratricopeptide (TPR) repeat protein
VNRDVAGTRAPLSDVGVYALLVIAVIAVFYQVLGHEFVDFDDITYVVENPHVTSGITLGGLIWAFTQSYEGYWAPLTWLSYMADVELFGLSSAAIHATNVLIHALTACLLFASLNRATRARWLSACVAALFAVHPLHVESVAWIAERKDVLGAFWYVLAIWAYLRYVERRVLGRYVLVAVAFGCGLMSKPMIVTLPVVLLLFDVWPLRRLAPEAASHRQATATPATFRGLVLEKVPLLAMSLIVAVVTVVVQSGAGAVAPLQVAPLSTRVANALVSCTVYLRQMVWPAGLAALYPYPRAVPAWQALAAAVLLAGISFAVVRARRRAPYLVVGWLWYLVTLLPVLGFIQAGPQARADRYTYLAMTGIAIIGAWGIAQGLGRFRRGRAAVGGAVCVALAAYGAVAWRQVQYWHSTESVFRRALAVTSGNYVAHQGLGTELFRSGRIDEAIGHLRSAVALAPDYAEAHSNLGRALLAADQAEDALVHLTHAVRLRPAEHDFRLNRGSALYALGRSQDAEAEYRAAVRFAPDSADAHSGLGLALAQKGDLENARSELETAIRLNPGYADAHLNLGTILARIDRNEEAERAFSEFVRLKPDAPEGHAGLGTLFARQGRIDEAIAALSNAVRLRPDDAILRSNLGITLISHGRIEEGTAQLSEAVRLRPDLPEMRHNLDLALTMRRPSPDAGTAPTGQPRSPRR